MDLYLDLLRISRPYDLRDRTYASLHNPLVATARSWLQTHDLVNYTLCPSHRTIKSVSHNADYFEGVIGLFHVFHLVVIVYFHKYSGPSATQLHGRFDSRLYRSSRPIRN